jgi:UDP-N-acetylmuramoyl-tripeptide--D-alanyl-D-alanine ligase
VPRRVSDLLDLLRSPLGRLIVRGAPLARAWPVLAHLAALHRRLVVPRTRVIAVIGSFGKSTTARAVVAALGARPLRAFSNAKSRLGLAVLRIRRGERWAVLEVGINQPGQMAGYARIVRPDVVVVTSIGSEHNRSLRGLEATRQEKAAMVRVLGPDGLAVLNGDDPHVRWMAGQTDARVVTFGFGAGNEVQATDRALDWPNGARLTVHAGGHAWPAQIRLLGRHQVSAVLAAVAVARAEGVPLEPALAALVALPPTPGRLEPVPLAGGALLLRDDFKGALETVDAALDLLAEVPARRRIVVLGDVTEPPGSQGPIYRRLGGRLAEVAEQAVIIGGSFKSYAVGACRAGVPREQLIDAGRSPAAAVRALAGTLRPGDVVLVKGRDTQRLERVGLALSGREVRCDIPVCHAPPRIRCVDCPMLARGWTGYPVVT